MSRPDPARFAAPRERFEEIAELDPAPRAEALTRLAETLKAQGENAAAEPLDSRARAITAKVGAKN